MSQEETRNPPLQIAVLSGGDSSEREVSLDSGRCVADALKGRGHCVELFDPAIESLENLSRSTEIILPMLHGTGAEDGTLQMRLDLLAFPGWGVPPSLRGSRSTKLQPELRSAPPACRSRRESLLTKPCPTMRCGRPRI